MLSFFARPLKTDLAPLFKKHVRSSRSREEDGHRCALFLSLFLSCFCNTHVKERELYYFLNRERKRIFSSRPHVTVFSGEDFFFVESSQKSASSIRRLFEEIHALRAPSVFLLNRSRECDRGKKRASRSNSKQIEERKREEGRERQI